VMLAQLNAEAFGFKRRGIVLIPEIVPDGLPDSSTCGKCICKNECCIRLLDSCKCKACQNPMNE